MIAAVVIAAVVAASGPPVREVTLAGDVGAAASAELAPLVAIRTGRPYDPAEGRKTLARLMATGDFAGAVIEQTRRPDGVALTIRLTRLLRLDGWRFAGNRHLEDRDLAGILTLRRGDPADPGRFKAYARAIAARYALEGFPRATASFAFVPGAKGRVLLETTIDEGPPLTLHALRVEGAADPKAVGAALGLKPGDRLTVAGLADAIERLNGDLVRLSGYDARVEYGFLTPEGRRVAGLPDVVASDARTLDLLVALTQGHPATVTVSADVDLPPEVLAATLPLLRYGDTSPSALEANAEALRKRYVAEGYPDAKVTPRISSDARAITFEVAAGPKFTVGAIRFEGVTAFPTAELEKAISTRPEAPPLPGGVTLPSGLPAADRGGVFDPGVWKDDMTRLAHFYHGSGFLEATVDGQRREPEGAPGRWTLVVKVDEGPRAKVAHVKLVGVPEERRGALIAALPMAPGAAYEPRRLGEVDAAGEAFFAAIGYARARVQARYEPASSTLVLDVTPGLRLRVGQVVIRGNVKTSEATIRERLGLKPGDWLDARALDEARLRLYQLGAFERVNWEAVTPPTANGQAVDLVLELTERPTSTIALGGGFGDLRAVRSSLPSGFGAYLGTSFQDTNGFGTGRPIRAEAQLSPALTSLLASVGDGTLVAGATSELGASYLRAFPYPDIDAGVRSAAIFSSLSRPFTPALSGVVRYSWGPTRYEVAPGALTQEQLATLGGLPDRIDSLVSLGLTTDTRDDLFEPRAGNYGELVLDVATPFLGGSLTYMGPRLRLARYMGLDAGPVLALYAEGGFLASLKPDQVIPPDALFFAGGQTLRGFGYRAVGVNDSGGVAAPGDPAMGGQAYWIARAEGRFSLFGPLGAVVFLDSANVWATPTEPNYLPKASAGVGLRYATPLGPVRLDYAVRLLPTAGLTDLQTAFSLGIGHAF